MILMIYFQVMSILALGSGHFSLYAGGWRSLGGTRKKIFKNRGEHEFLLFITQMFFLALRAAFL